MVGTGCTGEGGQEVLGSVAKERVGKSFKAMGVVAYSWNVEIHGPTRLFPQDWWKDGLVGLCKRTAMYRTLALIF